MSLTTAQLTTLLTELDTDPETLGYASYLTSQDFVSLAAILCSLRDGATVPPVSGAGATTGPNGTVVGATNATPIVIQTSAPHGRTTGESVVISGVLGNLAANSIPASPYGLPISGAVAPVPSWQITVVDSTHFSLNGSVGNGAYTSGGVWNWCISDMANGKAIFNFSVPAAQIAANILPADAAAATALSGTQTLLMPLLLNPQGSIQLLDNNGNELNSVAWLQLLTPAGSVSRKAVKALETRFGSRIEQILNAVSVGSPGQLITDRDVRAAVAGHY
jgi:hypothetical protein